MDLKFTELKRGVSEHEQWLLGVKSTANLIWTLANANRFKRATRSQRYLVLCKAVDEPFIGFQDLFGPNEYSVVATMQRHRQPKPKLLVCTLRRSMAWTCMNAWNNEDNQNVTSSMLLCSMMVYATNARQRAWEMHFGSIIWFGMKNDLKLISMQNAHTTADVDATHI